VREYRQRHLLRHARNFFVKGVLSLDTDLYGRDQNLSRAFRISAPGKSPASQRIWNPLQMPIIRPAARAPYVGQPRGNNGEKRA